MNAFKKNPARRWFVCASMLMISTGLAGCGKAATRTASQEVPVSGKVTLDGSPLADAQIQFKTANQATFTGATDSTGTYKLWSATGGEQVCEGPCVVTVSKFVLPEGATPQPNMNPMMQGGKQLLLPRYWDPARAVLSATVPAAGGTFDFPLESK